MKLLKFSALIFLLITVTAVKPLNNSEKLNFLFIIADDLNCALGVYGDSLAITPNIDKLAKEGIIFDNAHVQYPLCGPSRVSLMTGLYPDQTKSKKLRLYVRQTIPDVITLGQKFRMENYHSVRVGKIYHYHNPRDIGTAGHDDSFTWDRTINPYGRDKTDEYKLNGLKPRLDGGTLSWLQADGTDKEQTDGIGASETIGFLDEFAESGENFFLAFGLYRPHVPFVAPKPYFDMYDVDDFSVPKSSNDYLNTIPKPAAISVRAKKEQVDLDEDLAKEIKHAYYATTSFMDSQVGRVLDKLKETGLDKNTIVVFTSDHGYHLGEHGHWQKQTLFNDATRVPLIFAGPNIKKNNQPIEDPVELVDLYPTIMDMLDMQIPKFVSGKSLASYMKNSKIPVRESALTELQVNKGKVKAQGYGIKTRRYRLNQWKYNSNLSYELYDHRFDRAELNNLAAHIDYKNIKDSLIIVLENRIKEAKKVPIDLGKQIDDAKPWFEPKRIHSSSK
ncbi:sulfatase [Flavobacteriaceae bacterium]|nr:sulfatase [Flavobacteriaceae bacterium]MDC1493078.1 sulfatase [Flavobacteriaceae bacterium]